MSDDNLAERKPIDEDNSKTSSKNTHKRRWINYLIYPRFQLSMAGVNILILLSSLGVVVYQIIRSWDVFYSFAQKHNLVHNQIMQEMVAQMKAEFIMTVWLASIFSVLAGGFFTVVFSHKVVGAVYRLKEDFRNIGANGHQEDLTFRDGDLNRDVPEIINSAIQRIKDDEARTSPQRDIS